MAIAYGPLTAAGTIEKLNLPGVDEGLDAECEDYEVMREGLELVDDLRQGTKQLRVKHDKYLPRFTKEKENNYKRRWMTATLNNAFEETIGLLVGKAFSKPPSLDPDDVPAEIMGTETEDGLIEDMDLQGNHFDVFTQSFFKDALRSGVSHILVDMTTAPPLEEGKVRTQAEVKQLGLRPYWINIKASQVIGWRSEVNGGQRILTQVRIKERIEVPDGEYGTKYIDQIRVLRIGSYQLFRKEEGKDWEEHEAREMKGPDGSPLTFIPLVTLYTDEENGFMTAIPPLIDLAYMNIRHFQKQSDYDNCMTVACFPILCISGYNSEEDEVAIGPYTVAKLQDPSAKVYFAEHSGAALGSARTALEDSKEEMAMYGLKMLVSRPGATPTATQEVISEARTNYSQLQVAILRLKDSIELALQYTAQWLGIDSGGSVVVDINDLTLNPKDVDALLKAAGAPAKPVLDPLTVIEELKRRGFLGDEVDPKEVIERIKEGQTNSPNIAGLAGTFLKEQTGPPKQGPPPGTVVQ